MAIISKTRWHAIQSLFDQVLDLPETERAAFIEKSCGADPKLKREISDLLEAEKRSPDILDKPAKDMHKALITCFPDTAFFSDDDALDLAMENTTIGSFKLIRQIGRGGMGSVYLAERNVGDFDQTVAIKVLRDSSRSQDLLERFKREQQLLAALDHPNIAKLYDGGVSEDGQAYLVMEYVDGVTVDEYCLKHQLDIDARLSIIQQIAKAVGFAHKHLIIHRDLKPSNILVNTEGSVKLLDFSIAKLMNPQIEDINLTQVGQTPMTPGYAAPEQLKNQAVSVATDIYQLGLVAYLLLTGIPAHSNAKVSLASLIQQVCTQTPPMPSRVILKKSITSDSDATKKARKLRGDLDAIVLKMLQLEPEQRYPSMDALFYDVQAYFDCMPVSARQGPWSYPLKRGLLRHWKLATVASVFVLMLSAYAVTTTWQARKIDQALQVSRAEQVKAESVSDFLINIFRAADPNVSGLEEITARQLLEDGEKKIIQDLQNAPQVRNHMLNILALIWRRQGDYQHSQNVLKMAREAAKKTEKTNTKEYSKSLSISGMNYFNMGDTEQAIQYTSEAVELYENLLAKRLGAENDEYAYVLLMQGYVKSGLGGYQEALSMVERVIEILNSSEKINEEYLVLAYSELAFIQHMLGEFSDARAHMEKAAALQKRVTGENHTYYTRIITNLAASYQDAEQFDKAENLAREALRIHESIFGPEHVFSIHAKRTIAQILHRKGHMEDAEALLMEILNNKSIEYEPGSDRHLNLTIQLGSIMQDQGRWVEAEAQYRKVIDELSQKPETELLARTLTRLANLKFQQKAILESYTFFERALSIFEKQSIVTTIAELGIARVLLEMAQHARALEYAKNALEKRTLKFQMEHSWVIEAELVYSLVLIRNGRTQEAEPILSGALERAGRSPGFQFGDRLLLYQTAKDLLVETRQVL